ncbi:MAG: HAD-IA family hydrolase [Dehalococcoidales bacterium]|nr:MAG: HAD-IA family hydrolase [Dehalococcoidales bacterium]
MKYEAVIFDLFGTLVKNYTVQQHEGTLTEMAAILSAPRDRFIQLWYDTFNMRCLGELKTPEENVVYVCRELGIAVDKDLVKQAALVRYTLTRDTMIPLPGALRILTSLKNRGMKIGLVSDCSSEAPKVWSDTPFYSLFDITIFSCMEGVKKPDPRIYNLAADRLGVKPEDCLYIGDGSSNELTGAAAVGMHPVLIIDPEEDSSGTHRVDFEGDEWRGPVISSLKEVLTLV